MTRVLFFLLCHVRVSFTQWIIVRLELWMYLIFGDSLARLDLTLGNSEPVKQPPSEAKRPSKCASSSLTICLMFRELLKNKTSAPKISSELYNIQQSSAPPQTKCIVRLWIIQTIYFEWSRASWEELGWEPLVTRPLRKAMTGQNTKTNTAEPLRY